MVEHLNLEYAVVMLCSASFRHEFVPPLGEPMSIIEHYKAARELTLQDGTMFELGKQRIDGQELLAFVNAPSSLRDMWLLATSHGDADYLVYNDERLSYRQAAVQVAGFAHWLVEQGIEPGDRVAIAMRNYPEWMLAHWAINAVGAVVVGLNAWWVGEEMAYALKDSQPKLLIADDRRLLTFAGIAADFPHMRVIAVREDSPAVNATQWGDCVAGGAAMPEVTIDPDSEALVFYTSGTTGRPKGAQLTHRSCVANIMNVAAMGRIYASTQAKIKGAELSEAVASPAPLALIATPLFHVTANNCILQAGSVAGGKFVLMYKWDPIEAMRLIQAEQLTTLSAVPMMSRELLMHPNREDYDLSTLTAMGGGGAAMQPDLVSKVAAETKRAKPTQGYGMTEVSGIITYIAGDLFLARPESAGPLVPTLEGCARDKEGRSLPAGEIGEICVRGSPVIKGYLNRPEATAETIVDGWLKTGDLGYFDEDGFIYLVDRAKDMILRGGENIYGAEVENGIFDHPAVLECIAFAVPDERLGEEVGAAIHLKEGAMLDAAGMREHLAAKMAAFKIPRYMWFLAEPLPRNANGKFLKRELKDILDPANAD